MNKPLVKYGDKILFALALAVLAASLFRPGTKAEKAVTQITASKVVFTQWWQDYLEKDTLQTLIKEFEDLHSDIKIVLNDSGYEELRRELFNPGETLPGDVVALDPRWVTELIKRETVDSAGAPLLSFINVLYYNVEILKEAGFVRPPKNRSEFLNYAKAAAGEEGRFGLAPDSGGSGFLYEDVYSWIWAAGANLVKDGKAFPDPRRVEESLSFLAALNREGIFPAGVFSGENSASPGKKADDFIAGKPAFMIAPAADIWYVRERMGDSAFGITSVPPPDDYAGKPYYGTAAWTPGVHAASAFKEEAALFVSFLGEKAPFLAEKARVIPVNALIPPGPDPFYSKVWDIAISGESAQDFSGIADEYELEEIFREELSRLFAGTSAPAETVTAIQKRWEAVLYKNQPLILP